MEKSVNIITLNVPFPPDYGGIIDSFYRIKDLHSLGIKIYLHSFLYNRPPADELEKYCEKVYYYKRDLSFVNQLSFSPFIIKSRANKDLLDNLLRNKYPILFDGLHAAWFLNHSLLSDRKKIVRAHNIEHDYYKNLSKYEKKLIKKLYYRIESIRLQWFEKKLKNVDHIATVSTIDNIYYTNKFGNAVLIPSSHKFCQIVSMEGNGRFIIYHGDLSVIENELIVLNIVRNIAPEVDFPFIIAGKNPTPKLIKEIKKYNNIRLISNPSHDEMESLIENAHIHLLPVIKPCGLKLKLLYALYAGRFCVVNEPMINGTNLGILCEIVNTNSQIIDKLNELKNEPFSKEIADKRKEFLDKYYSPLENARKFVSLM